MNSLSSGGEETPLRDRQLKRGVTRSESAVEEDQALGAKDPGESQ